jgi:hypothetical protein
MSLGLWSESQWYPRCFDVYFIYPCTKTLGRNVGFVRPRCLRTRSRTWGIPQQFAWGRSFRVKACGARNHLMDDVIQNPTWRSGYTPVYVMWRLKQTVCSCFSFLISRCHLQLTATGNWQHRTCWRAGSTAQTSVHVKRHVIAFMTYIKFDHCHCCFEYCYCHSHHRYHAEYIIQSGNSFCMLEDQLWSRQRIPPVRPRFRDPRWCDYGILLHIGHCQIPPLLSYINTC